jgi:hypothetical protein
MRTTEDQNLTYILRKTFVLLTVMWPYNTLHTLDAEVKRDKHKRMMVLLTTDDMIQAIEIEPADYLNDTRSDQDILYNKVLHALSDQLQDKHSWS